MHKKQTSGIIQLQKVSERKLSQARQLRKRQTPTEVIMWNNLRAHKCGGLKFRRQQIIEGFIVDFYCESKKLVIEIDGKYHDTLEQQKLDQHRRDVFEARGLTEMRFTNEEVLGDLDNVLGKIVSF